MYHSCKELSKASRIRSNTGSRLPLASVRRTQLAHGCTRCRFSRRFACAAATLLLGCMLRTGGQAQDPLLVVPVPAIGAESQVSADGKYCVVITPTNAQSFDGTRAWPAELQLIDLSSRQIAARRTLAPARMPTGDHRRSITPDGQFYSWFSDDGSIVVSRVLDGHEAHRADQHVLDLGTTGCRDGFWLSDDGTFFLTASIEPEPGGRERGKSGRWVRVEITPTPRVAAISPAPRRNGSLISHARMCGDRETGRIVALVKRKNVYRHVLMNMNFETLAESPVELSAGCLPFFSGAGPATDPLLLIMPFTNSQHSWVVFSTKGDRLKVAQSSQRYYGIGGASDYLSGAISPDGQYLVGCRVGSPRAQAQSWLSVWSVIYARSICELPVNADRMCGFRFGAGGKYVSATSSKNVFVWDFSAIVNSAGDSLGSSSR